MEDYEHKNDDKVQFNISGMIEYRNLLSVFSMFSEIFDSFGKHYTKLCGIRDLHSKDTLI